jgi:hypothetical protein
LKALRVGRILRLLLGAWLVFALWPFFRGAGSSQILGAVLVVVGLALFYTLLHWLVSSFWTKVNCCLGACLAILPVLLVYVFGGVVGQVGVAGFLAISLLLAAVRGDAGCEVMSIPALVFGRRTHLMCLLFSPIDRIEEKIVGARPNSAAGSEDRENSGTGTSSHPPLPEVPVPESGTR